MREATGLSCSIGITPNKLLSKIASELDKPDGLTLLGHADIPARIWPLAARKVNGIGPKAAAKLVGARHRDDRRRRRGRAGVPGRALRQELRRLDARRRARPRRAAGGDRRASRSRSAARRPSTATCTRCATATSSARSSPSCARKLAGDLSRKGYAAKTIGIKLRFDDFRIATRALTLPAHTLDGREIRRAAGQCLKRVDLGRRLRLLGVRASALCKVSDLLDPYAAEPSPPALSRGAGAGAGLPLFAMTTASRSRSRERAGVRVRPMRQRSPGT